MRKYLLILALALLMLLLHACANTNYIHQEDLAAPTTDHIEGPSTDVTAQEDIVAETGVAAPSPSPEDNATPDVNPKPEPVPEMPQSSTGEQPPLMTLAVQAAGLTFEDLAFSQFVLVAADGTEAMLYCYDKDDNGQWTLNEDIGYIKGYVGKNGISSAKSEGDGNTPAGLYSLGYAFGNNQKPLTAMAYKEITKESYWVDDPDSIYYNQWVEGNDDADWTSAEHLSECLSSYAYAVVVEYNVAPNTISGAGSAIFLHCGTKPTAGCIAVSQGTLLKILKWLSPDKNPSILIVAP